METEPTPESPGIPAAERKLRLLLEIDDLRDAVGTPDHLLGSIADLMAEEFTADLCLLFVTDENSGQPKLKASGNAGTDSLELPPESLPTLTSWIRKIEGIAFFEGGEAQSLFSWDDDSLQVAVVPIVMDGDDRVGTLLLGRAGTPFTEAEIDLLAFAEGQLDSALVQARRLFELDLRNRELETIYLVDKIRDAHLSFDEMLDKLLAELKRIILSDLAFIMLYSPDGTRLELRGTSPRGVTADSDLIHHLAIASEESLKEGDLVLLENLERGNRSILCTPLILREQVLGVFGLISNAADGFMEGDPRLLRAIASQMDTAIFESLERGRLRNVLERTVDPQIMERLLEHPDVGILEGERLVLTVLYADLRGSTRLTETADPKHLVEFLNDYLGEMAEIILSHQGTLDKFMGDEVMALFGAPLPMKDHALRAVRVGLEMQRVHGGLMRKWVRRGLDAPPLGVGIATGEMIVGELGSGRRADYTVLGAPANLGSRIQGIADGGQVLISAETRRLVGDRVELRAIPGQRFKGIGHEVTVYEVEALREGLF